MKEFIEKLIGRLEVYKYSHLIERNSEQCEHCKDVEDCVNRDCSLCIWDKSIEIVNQLAEEMGVAKNAITTWIPVSERLPESNVLVLVYTNAGVICMDYYGAFCKDFIGLKGTSQKALAWQPLPQPYVPKGE